MTTASDTFAEFVAGLAGALDDHEATGEDWAARQHFSRYHRLDDTFVDAVCEQAEVFTYGGMVAHVLTFAAYRRTLVVMALARHGLDELGWGDPMRWVADRG